MTSLLHRTMVWLALGSCIVAADWPALHGNARHDGYIDANLQSPFRLAWVRHFPEERLGTAMEPIATDGRVYVATHRGNLYALDAATGNAVWAFAARGPFLQSPAVADSLVVAASTDGCVYALDAGSGRLRWRHEAGYGGFAASPTIMDGRVVHERR